MDFGTPASIANVAFFVWLSKCRHELEGDGLVNKSSHKAPELLNDVYGYYMQSSPDQIPAETTHGKALSEILDAVGPTQAVEVFTGVLRSAENMIDDSLCDGLVALETLRLSGNTAFLDAYQDAPILSAITRALERQDKIRPPLSTQSTSKYIMMRIRIWFLSFSHLLYVVWTDPCQMFANPRKESSTMSLGVWETVSPHPQCSMSGNSSRTA